MPTPDKYEVGYDFSGYQATSPSTPLPGGAVDNEFANIETSLAAAIDAINDVRRADGNLQNGAVGPDQLSSALTNNWRPRGAWSDAAVVYYAGDGVFHDGYFYVSRLQHTSDADSEPGVDTTSWLVQFALATAIGNMLVATYDPDFKEADVYNTDNHDDGTTNKVFTATEKTKLAGIEAAATAAPYLPAGAMMPYAGASEPSGWLFCYGQAVSRTTYAALFTALATTYGAGDGSTTFNLPDLRGRVIAGQDDMGGTSANRLTGLSGGVDGDVLGATGGAESHTLLTAQMASHTHSVTGTAASAGAHSHTLTNGTGAVGGTAVTAQYTDNTGAKATSTDGAHTHSVSGTAAAAGSDQAHNNVQPTIVLNYIIKT